MHNFTKVKLGADDNEGLENECCNEEYSSIRVSGEQLVGLE